MTRKIHKKRSNRKKIPLAYWVEAISGLKIEQAQKNVIKTDEGQIESNV